MTNIIKSALIIGSLLTPVAAFAGDAPADKTADKAPAAGDKDKPATTDKKDVKKDTKTPAKTPAKKPATTTPAKDAPPATK